MTERGFVAPLSRRLLHIFPSFEIGGAQIRFAQLVSALPKEYRHHLVALDDKTDALSRLAADAPVELETIQYNKDRAFETLRTFRRTLNLLKPDLLITYNWGSIEWALVNLFPRICSHVAIEDGFGPDETASPIPRRVLVRWLVYRHARAVVVPSRKLQRVALENWRVPPERLCYIPNGIRLERFRSTADRALAEGLGLVGPGPWIGTLAGLRKEKNVGRLLEAFAIAARDDSPARLAIFGDGPERSAIEARAESLGISSRVVFTGAVDDPAKILGMLAIYAVSSDTEQMPMSLIEAMAAGLPVAAVDVGDVAAMVSAENRHLVQGRDAGDLARSLCALLADPELAARLGRANQRAAERFSLEAMADAYDRVFSNRWTADS